VPDESTTNLRFGSGQTCVVSTRRVYVVTNDVSEVRLPDRVPVEYLSIALSTGADNWGWRVNATMRSRADFALIDPTTDPVELDITVNGVVRVMVVEVYSADRSSGSYSVGLIWRSRSVYLAAPHAPRAQLHRNIRDPTNPRI
jgi:hypothetical protein